MGRKRLRRPGLHTHACEPFMIFICLESPAMMGKLFVLASPLLTSENGQVVFYLTTTSEIPVHVQYSTPWHVGTKPLITEYIEVHSDRMNTVVFVKPYIMTIHSENQRWTYKFAAVKTFGISVFLIDHSLSVESMTVLPVSMWGKSYCVVQLWRYPFIQVVSRVSHNEVTIRFRVHYFGTDNPPEALLKTGHIRKMELAAFQGYTIHYCFNDFTKYTSFIGSKITSGRSFGVVSGNCHAITNTSLCHNQSREVRTTSGSIVAEMMLPSRFSGNQFITLVTSNRLTQGRTMVTSTQVNTLVRVYQSLQTFSTLWLKDAGENAILPLINNSLYIHSDKPVMVTYFQRSSCKTGGADKMHGNTKEAGDPAFTLVVPNDLFYYFYMWSSPQQEFFNRPANFLIIIANEEDFEDILLDGRQLPSYITNGLVTGLDGWHIYDMFLPAGRHSVRSEITNFGCYLYGLGTSFAYMHFAGFANTPIIKLCVPSPDNMTAGDYKDNDCDMRIDEELLNNIDDDGDALVDEDLKKEDITTTPINITTVMVTEPVAVTSAVTSSHAPPVATLQTTLTTSTTKATTRRRPRTKTTRVHTTSTTTNAAAAPGNKGLSSGTNNTTESSLDLDEYYWNDWSNWACSRDCSDTRMVQRRSCNYNVTLVCKGDDKKYKEGFCYVSDFCPNDCPKGTWGLNCKHECTHCDPDCDKFTGLCDMCKVGYQSPNQSCLEECGPFRYGFACKEDCQVKCGGDCLERVQGLCPAGPQRFLPLVLLIPVIPLAMFSILGRKSRTAEQTESFSSKSFHV
ncbi:hypothetical protein Btru_014795 [Bulinus truncatus]|nr:hypothetical protein Btru_014795 [Bulinus truncatus]